MSTVNHTDADWRKSSYSGGSGSNGACVEVTIPGFAVAVRDSKSPDSGTVAVCAAAWHAFISRASS